MSAQPQTASPEFSRLIAIEGIAPDKTRTEKVEATEEECALLAERLGLRDLTHLSAEVRIRRVPGGTAIRLEGSFKAELVQICVVSLRDVPARVEGSFETFFTEDAGPQRGETEISFDNDLDSAEMVVNGMIDLGEAVVQYLSLEMDPYPRAPGVSLAAQLAGVGVEGKPNPFQVLEKLKKAEKDGQ